MTDRAREGNRAGAVLLALALGLASSPSRAAGGSFEVIAGWEGLGTQGYGFVTAGVLVPAGKSVVLPIRLSGSWLYYRYDSTGTSNTVRSPGASLMTGAHVQGTRGGASLLAGVEVRRDRRQVDTPGAPVRRETTAGVVVQADGDLGFGRRWRAFLFGNYAGAASYLYGRAALRAQLTHLDWKPPAVFFAGAEFVPQGNDESRALQGGPFLEWSLIARHASLALHGGYKEWWSPGQRHHRGAYVGVGLYQRF